MRNTLLEILNDKVPNMKAYYITLNDIINNEESLHLNHTQYVLQIVANVYFFLY